MEQAGSAVRNRTAVNRGINSIWLCGQLDIITGAVEGSSGLRVSYADP